MAMLTGRHEANRFRNIRGGAKYLYQFMTRYFPDARFDDCAGNGNEVNRAAMRVAAGPAVANVRSRSSQDARRWRGGRGD